MSRKLAELISEWGDTAAEDCDSQHHNDRNMNCSQALWSFFDKLFGSGHGFDYCEDDDE